MFIKDGKRFNPNAPIVIDGVSYGDAQLLKFPEVMASYGVAEIPDPIPPEDFSDDLYYRTEQDDAPYVVWTRKSDEQIAAVRWAKIKQLRDELTEDGGCLVAGKWFHSDVKSKQQQMALVMMGASIPASLMWKTLDGSFVVMTQALAAELFAAQAAREQAIFAHAETLKADIAADITQGWPARYTKEAV